MWNTCGVHNILRICGFVTFSWYNVATCGNGFPICDHMYDSFGPSVRVNKFLERT